MTNEYRLRFSTAVALSASGGVVFVVLVLLLYWLCGYNFDERGPAAFFCFAFSFIALVGGGSWIMWILCSMNFVKELGAT